MIASTAAMRSADGRAVHVERVVEAARDHAAPIDRQFQADVFLLLFGRDEADVRRRAHRARGGVPSKP